MQPYPNPNYFNQNPYQQNYNPLMNAQMRLQQMEQQYPQFTQQNQFMPQPQVSGIAGRIVNDFSEITANEVPMDNVGAVFMKADMSEICKKMWNAKTGMIETTLYKPYFERNEVQGTNMPTNAEKLKIGLSDEVTEVFTQYLNNISSRIGGIEQFLASLGLSQGESKPKASARKKAEGNSDEQ